MFFQLNDTFSSSQSAAKRKQLAVLSPGRSPTMPHTESENEMEAVGLVCVRMGWRTLSRPLPLKSSGLTALVFATRLPLIKSSALCWCLWLTRSPKVLVVFSAQCGRTQRESNPKCHWVMADRSSVQYRWMSCVTITVTLLKPSTITTFYSHVPFCQ